MKTLETWIAMLVVALVVVALIIYIVCKHPLHKSHSAVTDNVATASADTSRYIPNVGVHLMMRLLHK